jgi:signal transduction histidine kinase
MSVWRLLQLLQAQPAHKGGALFLETVHAHYLSELDGRSIVIIENPGAPISEEHIPRLFDRFYRADASRQQATGEGTGLGLAITQAIVKAHLGKISVRSDDRSTSFVIDLPINRTPISA